MIHTEELLIDGTLFTYRFRGFNIQLKYTDVPEDKEVVSCSIACEGMKGTIWAGMIASREFVELDRNLVLRYFGEEGAYSYFNTPKEE